MKMKKKQYLIRVKVLTGLHIGVGSDRPEIGGIDNPFIKDPVNQRPYIPGSSLKGKLRFLLETESDNYDGPEDKKIKTYFGDDESSPTRLIFKDISLSKEHLDSYEQRELVTEIKTEIMIDREKGNTKDGTLRTTERMPPETVFEGNLLVRFYDDNELNDVVQMLTEAVELLNNDYLGGSGSRGYGAVKVTLQQN